MADNNKEERTRERHPPQNDHKPHKGILKKNREPARKKRYLKDVRKCVLYDGK
jgi:hypothetical protein